MIPHFAPSPTPPPAPMAQWNPTNASRERMALPPISLSVSTPLPHGHPMQTTPVMLMVPGHPMLSPPGAMASLPPPYMARPAQLTATTCSPSMASKKRIRAIPNATKSITIDLLRPHFDRPLAEVAAMFGICMTLMKKICRKNGVPRWPHRQIRGLRKSIWSIEKALRSCESDAQRRSYVDHLEKQKDKLAAILRGPDGTNRSAFHELVMSVPCSPMSDLATPKAPATVSSPTAQLASMSSLTLDTRPRRMSAPTPPTIPLLTPTHGTPSSAASTPSGQTPTISRLPSIATMLAAHAAKEPRAPAASAPFPPAHVFQC